MDKKIILLFLVGLLISNPLIAKAEQLKTIEGAAPIEEVQQPTYIKFEGTIKEINIKDKSYSILVENDSKDNLNKLVSFITEDVVLIEDDTMEFIQKEDLKKDMVVLVYYHKETPILMSYPPQLTPDAIVVRTKSFINTVADKFDHDLISSDGSLRVNIHEDTEVVNKKNNEVDKDKIGSKDLIFSYINILESYPAQVNPKKIIVLRHNEPEVMDKVIINNEKTKLQNNLYKTEENVLMVPLRQIAEKLGYKVEWIHETKSVELTKDTQWAKVTIGEDSCSFAETLTKLEAAPELINSKTYVPLSFLERILISNTQYTAEGVLKITQY